ncbi:MAG: hypothetical protein Q8L24_00145 [bacterium]|nr:hypothetical protein [bacterium]
MLILFNKKEIDVKASIATAIFSAIFLFGCGAAPTNTEYQSHSVFRPLSDPRSEYALVVRGSPSEKQVLSIKSAVSYLPGPILESLVPFEICRDKEHLAGEYGGRTGQGDHYCAGNWKICLRDKESISTLMIWHESMHAFDEYLDSIGKSPIEKWRQIAGDVYDEEDTGLHCDRAFSSDGLMNDYSRCSPWEDRAEFFVQCLGYLHNRANAIEGHSYFKNDPRYIAKLKELKDEGLFTEKEYQTLRPLFQ